MFIIITNHLTTNPLLHIGIEIPPSFFGEISIPICVGICVKASFYIFAILYGYLHLRAVIQVVIRTVANILVFIF
jgi:hypothetical protein